METLKMPTKKPLKIGSAAWEKNLINDPTYVKNMIDLFRREAACGKKEAIERLNRWLDRFPEHRGTVPALKALTVKVEDAWARAVAFGDPLAEQGAKEETAKLKAELLAPDASFIEQILVSMVAVAYLSNQHAAAVASVKTNHTAVMAARDRRQTVAQRRLLDALKGWSMFKKKSKGVNKPPLKLYRPPVPAAKAG
jgi:hypothetical protein